MNSSTKKRRWALFLIGVLMTGTGLIILILLCFAVWPGQDTLLLRLSANEPDRAVLSTLDTTGLFAYADQVSIHSTQKAMIQNHQKALEGTVVYVASPDDWRPFSSYTIAEGRMFWDGDDSIRYALIPQALAVELYGPASCLGKSLVLEGKEYAVLGVYEEQSSFLDVLAYETNLPVFALSRDFPGTLSLIVDAVPPNESALTLSATLQMLSGSDINHEEKYNLSYRIHAEKWRAKLYIGIWIISVLLIAWKGIAGFRRKIKQQIMNNYSSRYRIDALLFSKWQLLLYCGTIVSFIIVMCAAITFVFRDWMVLPEYVPATLLWPDILETIKQYIHELNAFSTIRHPWVLWKEWAARAITLGGYCLLIGSLIIYRECRCMQQCE